MPVGKAPVGTWVCPVCGRRVPRREAECFCGAKQVQAEQHLQREEEKKSTRIPLDLAFLVVLLVLVAVYGVHRVTQEQQDVGLPEGARNALAVVVATPEPPLPPPPLPARAPQPTARPADEPPRAPQPPLPPLATPAPSAEPSRVAIPAPAPSPTPTPFDERAQVRAAGLAAYEAELQRLASAAGRLDQHVRAFARECGDTQKFAYAVSNCAEIESTVRREMSQLQQGLDAADDLARRAWLEPGTVRDARSRSFFGSREWDTLQSSARSLKR